MTATVPCVRGVVATGDGWPLPGAAITVVGPAGSSSGGPRRTRPARSPYRSPRPARSR